MVVVSPITPEETKFDLAGEGFLSKEYQSTSLGIGRINIAVQSLVVNYDTK